MPRIPQRPRPGQRHQRTDQFIHRPNMHLAGIEGDAVRKLGESISQNISQLGREIQSAKAARYVSETQTQDVLEYDEFSSDQKRRYHDGEINEDQYRESISDWLNRRFQDNQNEAPNRQARDLYAQRSSNFFEKNILRARQEAREFEISRIEQSAQREIENLSRAVVSNPSYVSDAIEIANSSIADKTSSNVFTQDQAFDMQQQMNNAISTSYFEGLLQQDRPEDALDYLMQEGGEVQRDVMSADQLSDSVKQQFIEESARSGEFSEEDAKDAMENPARPRFAPITAENVDAGILEKSLSSDEKMSFLNRAQRAVSQKKKRKFKQFNARKRDYKAALQSGQTARDTSFENELASFHADGIIGPQKFARELDDIAISAAVGDLDKSAHDVPTDQLMDQVGEMGRLIQSERAAVAANNPEVADIVQDENFNFERRQAASQVAQSQMEEIRKSRMEDFASYAVATDEQSRRLVERVLPNEEGRRDPGAVSEWRAHVKSKADSLNQPSPTQNILPRSIAQQEANLLQSLGEASHQSAMMSDIQNAYGQDFNRVFEEMKQEADNKDFFNKIEMATYFSPEDQKGRADIFNAANVNTRELKESYNSLFGERAFSDLETEVDDVIADYSQSMFSDNPSGKVVDQINGMRDIMKNRAASIKQSNPQMSESDAVEAASDFITQTFGEPIVKDNTFAMVPRHINGEPVRHDWVEAAVDYFQREDGLMDLPIEEKEGLDKRQTIRELTENGPVRWVGNDTGDGFVLEALDVDMGENVVYQPVLSNQGGDRPVEIFFNERESEREISVEGLIKQGGNFAQFNQKGPVRRWAEDVFSTRSSRDLKAFREQAAERVREADQRAQEAE